MESFVIRGTNYGKGPFTIDPSKNPKHIDLPIGVGDEREAPVASGNGSTAVTAPGLMARRVLVVDECRRTGGGVADAEFRTEDISDWAAFRVANQDLLEESYDIVLYLGIYHRSRCQRDISENGLPETCDRDRILPSAIFDANRQPLSG
jgi:hypothetical protein